MPFEPSGSPGSANRGNLEHVLALAGKAPIAIN